MVSFTERRKMFRCYAIRETVVYPIVADHWTISLEKSAKNETNFNDSISITNYVSMPICICKGFCPQRRIDAPFVINWNGSSWSEWNSSEINSIVIDVRQRQLFTIARNTWTFLFVGARIVDVVTSSHPTAYSRIHNRWLRRYTLREEKKMWPWEQNIDNFICWEKVFSFIHSFRIFFPILASSWWAHAS